VLSDDPHPLRRTYLLVVPGRVTADPHPALRALNRAGWESVTTLFADDPASTSDLPPDARVPEFHGDGPAERSDRVRHAVERAHREHRYDLIVFAGLGGLGARAVQAKRAGLAFGDVPLAVLLDANSQHERERQTRWPSCFAEVETDYLERYAFENADVQCLPDDALAAFVRGNHWAVRPDAVKSLAPAECAPYRNEVSRQANDPLVTLAIAHYNLGQYLPDTLATLAGQTYGNFEVIVIDDGSTDAASVEVFESMRAKYPAWRFLRQANAGIGATRNRCLELARGEFFIPVDADNLARPEMVAKFVAAMRHNPALSAMSCYFLAFDTDAPNLRPERYLYALRPAGGPHALAGIRNVYGDANAVFRTAALREIGGYGTDRGTSCEDWECFVKLVHAGHRLGVVPDHLFYYRHRPGGFSRSTNWFANHQRVLRQFAHAGSLPPAESLALWAALLGFHQELERRAAAPVPRRHRLADWLYSVATRPVKWVRGRTR
jgi:glycosyltransferase involved in cell wall biosynthesis